MYEIRQRFIKNNRSYKKFKPIGTTVHDTDNEGATDENHFDYFNYAYRGASAHAFIDWDSITQLIPWDEQAWHAGTTANSRYIGIELCRPKSHDPAKFEEIWKRGAWLFAWVHVNILKNTRLDSNNFISHADATMRWKQTNHMDPVAYFREYGKTVDDFRNDVQKIINQMIGIETDVKGVKVTVKNLVVFGNSIDRRAAEYLADYLQCPTLDGSIPFDYSNVENVICVGGAPTTNGKTGWTSYAKKIITGVDRYDTMVQVLKFIKRI